MTSHLNSDIPARISGRFDGYRDSQPTQQQIDRRQFERFSVPPMYTSVGIRPIDIEVYLWEGHAYDVSEGGIRFELDRGIAPGTRVGIRIDLPQRIGTVPGTADAGPERALFAIGTVVWADDSEPGPVQMAAVITRFARDIDRERLLRQFRFGHASLRAA